MMKLFIVIYIFMINEWLGENKKINVRKFGEVKRRNKRLKGLSRIEGVPLTIG